MTVLLESGFGLLVLFTATLGLLEAGRRIGQQRMEWIPRARGSAGGRRVRG